MAEGASRSVAAKARGAERLKRKPGGRQRRLHVVMSEDEYLLIAARAAATRLSVPRLLVEAAMAGSTATVSERRALAAELMAARRLIAAVGSNLNQLARVANATGQVRPEVSGAAQAAGRAAVRLEEAAAAIQGGGR